ncbi:MAG: L-rhamnose isomerase [Armatimonadetes bacterium]|nr:L-rhamnose isomerase [Armatimonadota bacterium]
MPTAARTQRTDKTIETAFRLAKEQFAAVGVKADLAVKLALGLPISAHCWQGDDVKGLETKSAGLSTGGIQATGNYPGAARTGDEIRRDFEVAAGLIPGKLRFNLHASYAETGEKVVDRDAIQPRHFAAWLQWAKERGYGLDFNPTFFAHPLAESGMTLAHQDKAVREFWVEHARACRRIARSFAKELGPSVCNIWIPDGMKDSTVDRWSPRERLVESLDAILDGKMAGVVDAVESKLFGIGCEDYTVGSHEFYLLYALSRGVVLCYDLGHFHPTESIADKLSSTMQFLDRILVHVSRGVRWDSDHVVLFNDEVRALCQEAVRGKVVNRIYWSLDFFDASINRIGAWVVGTRALRKALLYALLEPTPLLAKAEAAGRGAEKLALLERSKELPFGAVWDYACLTAGVPVGAGWVADMNAYEKAVLAGRK